MKRVYICAPDCGNTARDWKQITKYIKYALLCGTAPVVPQIYARFRESEILKKIGGSSI